MWADWRILLSFLGALQGLLLATFLFFNGKNGSATKYLSVFTLVFSVGLLERVIAPFKESILFFWLPDLVGITSFLYGPLFYLYVFKSLNASKKVVVHKHLLVFYAFCIELLIVSVLRQLFDYQLSEYFTQVQELISFQLLFAQLFYYGYKSFLLLRSEKHPQSFLKWLFYLTSSLMVIYIISYISTTLLLLGFHFGKPLMVFVQFGCVAVVYSFSYHALLQKNQINQQLDTPPKYNNSPIISENKPEYLRRIVDSMEKDHLFLDPLLTLNKLSDKLDINRFYVSQVINEELGKSFPDFVNAYRIEKTKSLLESDKGNYYTLLAIAYESGFNSKTSFNNVFKKQTGYTPSAYRKAVLKNTTFDKGDV